MSECENFISDDIAHLCNYVEMYWSYKCLIVLIIIICGYLLLCGYF